MGHDIKLQSISYSMSKEITCTVSKRYGTAARTCLLPGKKKRKTLIAEGYRTVRTSIGQGLKAATDHDYLQCNTLVHFFPQKISTVTKLTVYPFTCEKKVLMFSTIWKSQTSEITDEVKKSCHRLTKYSLLKARSED